MKQESSSLSPVAHARVRIDDNFWSPRIETNRTHTLPAIYKQLQKSGRMDALGLKWKKGDQNPPHFLWESDIAKWIEAACCSMTAHPDPALAAQVEELIQLLLGAQQPDGYLNVYYTVVEPGKRWSNLRDKHELYCAGHLFEAAVAHYEATGKKHFLEAMCRYADCIDHAFGPESKQLKGYCGHPEIELALIRLWRSTQEPRYLNLARFFLEQRGTEPHYFDVEAKERGEQAGDYWARTHEYTQSHISVFSQDHIVGHALRALYLCCGLADVGSALALQKDPRADQYFETLERLWSSIYRRQIYLTGGIGPSRENEGFTRDYDLPNETANAETCVSIASVFLNHRLLQHTAESRYADELERVLYNSVLSGVSLEGDQFFDANPLAFDPARMDPKDPIKGDRSPWFECACCPPNIARLLTSIGEYIYSEGSGSLFVHQFIQSQVDLQVHGQTVRLNQITNYPWKGKTVLKFEMDQVISFDLHIRLPGWCREGSVDINGEPQAAELEKGYVVLKRKWAPGDTLEMRLSIPVQRVHSHPSILQNTGKVALQRGPIIYCLEGLDHEVPLSSLILPPQNDLVALHERRLLGGVTTLHGEAVQPSVEGWQNKLYRFPRGNYKTVPIKAIPYCVWANRGPTEMRVWLGEIF